MNYRWWIVGVWVRVKRDGGKHHISKPSTDPNLNLPLPDKPDKKILTPLYARALFWCVSRGQPCGQYGTFCHNSSHFGVCIEQLDGSLLPAEDYLNLCPEGTVCDSDDESPCIAMTSPVLQQFLSTANYMTASPHTEIADHSSSEVDHHLAKSSVGVTSEFPPSSKLQLYSVSKKNYDSTAPFTVITKSTVLPSSEYTSLNMVYSHFAKKESRKPFRKYQSEYTRKCFEPHILVTSSLVDSDALDHFITGAQRKACRGCAPAVLDSLDRDLGKKLLNKSKTRKLEHGLYTASAQPSQCESVFINLFGSECFGDVCLYSWSELSKADDETPTISPTPPTDGNASAVGLLRGMTVAHHSDALSKGRTQEYTKVKGDLLTSSYPREITYGSSDIKNKLAVNIKESRNIFEPSLESQLDLHVKRTRSINLSEAGDTNLKPNKLFEKVRFDYGTFNIPEHSQNQDVAIPNKVREMLGSKSILTQWHPTEKAKTTASYETGEDSSYYDGDHEDYDYYSDYTDYFDESSVEDIASIEQSSDEAEEYESGSLKQTENIDHVILESLTSVRPSKNIISNDDNHKHPMVLDAQTSPKNDNAKKSDKLTDNSYETMGKSSDVSTSKIKTGNESLGDSSLYLDNDPHFERSDLEKELRANSTHSSSLESKGIDDTYKITNTSDDSNNEISEFGDFSHSSETNSMGKAADDIVLSQDDINDISLSTENNPFDITSEPDTDTNIYDKETYTEKSSTHIPGYQLISSSDEVSYTEKENIHKPGLVEYENNSENIDENYTAEGLDENISLESATLLDKYLDKKEDTTAEISEIEPSTQRSLSLTFTPRVSETEHTAQNESLKSLPITYTTEMLEIEPTTQTVPLEAVTFSATADLSEIEITTETVYLESITLAITTEESEIETTYKDSTLEYVPLIVKTGISEMQSTTQDVQLESTTLSDKAEISEIEPTNQKSFLKNVTLTPIVSVTEHTAKNESLKSLPITYTTEILKLEPTTQIVPLELVTLTATTDFSEIELTTETVSLESVPLIAMTGTSELEPTTQSVTLEPLALTSMTVFLKGEQNILAVSKESDPLTVMTEVSKIESISTNVSLESVSLNAITGVSEIEQATQDESLESFPLSVNTGISAIEPTTQDASWESSTLMETTKESEIETTNQNLSFESDNLPVMTKESDIQPGSFNTGESLETTTLTDIAGEPAVDTSIKNDSSEYATITQIKEASTVETHSSSDVYWDSTTFQNQNFQTDSVMSIYGSTKPISDEVTYTDSREDYFTTTEFAIDYMSSTESNEASDEFYDSTTEDVSYGYISSEEFTTTEISTHDPESTEINFDESISEESTKNYFTTTEYSTDSEEDTNEIANQRMIGSRYFQHSYNPSSFLSTTILENSTRNENLDEINTKEDERKSDEKDNTEITITELYNRNYEELGTEEIVTTNTGHMGENINQVDINDNSEWTTKLDSVWNIWTKEPITIKTRPSDDIIPDVKETAQNQQKYIENKTKEGAPMFDHSSISKARSEISIKQTMQESKNQFVEIYKDTPRKKKPITELVDCIEKGKNDFEFDYSFDQYDDSSSDKSNQNNREEQIERDILCQVPPEDLNKFERDNEHLKKNSDNTGDDIDISQFYDDDRELSYDSEYGIYDDESHKEDYRRMADIRATKTSFHVFKTPKKEDPYLLQIMFQE
ncbi:unnamed protein product [Timema podura]|uniref:Uncharacterized protein n=1 Tax=Timema podura TaxID=61482 RepID=A0ABN7NE05_TIMPD|nr:unnamed protein product [Timema podura]